MSLIEFLFLFFVFGIQILSWIGIIIVGAKKDVWVPRWGNKKNG